MKLAEAVTPTAVLRTSMTMREGLRECVERSVPGVPVVDDEDNIIGRFSIRNAFLVASIPIDIIKGAHLLGHDLEHLEFPHQRVREVLAMPICDIALEEIVRVRSTAQVITALALMEKYNSSYIFAIDDGVYRGVVTRQDIARMVLAAPQDLL